MMAVPMSSRRLFGVLCVVVAVLLSPVIGYGRRRGRLDSIYQQQSRRSYVRIIINAWFPPFRCRSAVAVSPFRCRSSVP